MIMNNKIPAFLLAAAAVVMCFHQTTASDKPGCPTGFFMSDGSSQCFKFFLEKGEGTWSAANATCVDEGLEMANPTDQVALQLRKDLFDKYGRKYVWLSGRGNGSHWVTSSSSSGPQQQQEGEEKDEATHLLLSTDHPLWQPGHGSAVATGRCQVLFVDEHGLRNYPEQPYISWPCSSTPYALCQVVATIIKPTTTLASTTTPEPNDASATSTYVIVVLIAVIVLLIALLIGGFCFMKNRAKGQDVTEILEMRDMPPGQAQRGDQYHQNTPGPAVLQRRPTSDHIYSDPEEVLQLHIPDHTLYEEPVQRRM